MENLNKILKAIVVFFHPKGRKYIFTKGASISSFNINSILHKINPSIKTIIDVGANIGQFATASHVFYPNAIIHSFEPIIESFNKLKINTEKIKNINIYNCALGDTEGTIDFFHNDHSHASSALEVSIQQKEMSPLTRNYKKIEVPIHKLDSFSFSMPLSQPTLLKLDVQGFEKQVLLGGETFLKKVDYILLEMSFVPMYDNEPLFDEMHKFITERGFKLIGPLDYLPSIMQMDMLYSRS